MTTSARAGSRPMWKPFGSMILRCPSNGPLFQRIRPYHSTATVPPDSGAPSSLSFTTRVESTSVCGAGGGGAAGGGAGAAGAGAGGGAGRGAGGADGRSFSAGIRVVGSSTRGGAGAGAGGGGGADGGGAASGGGTGAAAGRCGPLSSLRGFRRWYVTMPIGTSRTINSTTIPQTRTVPSIPVAPPVGDGDAGITVALVRMFLERS